METEQKTFNVKATKRNACLAVGSQRKVGDLAVVEGRIFTDLRVLADAINAGKAAFGDEAIAALAPLRDSARAPCGPRLYAIPYELRSKRRWQVSVVEVGGLTPSGRHARTVRGELLPTSKLYAWSGSVSEAWVAPGNDRLHRLDGPAVLRDGGEEWWRNSRRHRVGGPALTVGKRREWWASGRLHREDGPAVEDGRTREWWVRGELHREDGPAVVSSTGKEWRQRGALHRLDGPAIERQSRREWYAHGLPHRADGPAEIEVADGTVFASWFRSGSGGACVEVHPMLYVRAAAPYAKPLHERGEVSRLAGGDEWLCELLAIPASRRDVLDSLSRRPGEQSDFTEPSDV